MRQFQDRENGYPKPNGKEGAHDYLGAKIVAAKEVAETDRDDAT
jgi:hypothetical protein